MEDRNIALKRLNNVIDQSTCRINAILSKLGWSKENILQMRDETGKDNAPKTYRSDEVFPPSSFPSDAACSVKMDNVKQAEAILEGFYQDSAFELGVPLNEICSREPPSNIEELHVNFTREERLSLYEHAVKNTLPPPNVPDIKIRFKLNSQSEEKRASLSEIAAMERDSRRRNPKHRVARNPLTYQEEVRHLINIQTEALTQHFQQEATLSKASSSRADHNKHYKRSRRSPSPNGTEEYHRRKKRKRSKSRSRSKDRSHRRKEGKKHKKKHHR